ncbi:MAG: hypothetical protein QM765_05625 [Myxococcales bacterium]
MASGFCAFVSRYWRIIGVSWAMARSGAAAPGSAAPGSASSCSLLSA